MSRKADLAALTELSCRRARQGRVESTSFRHSLSPLSLALTPSFTLLPLHPATPSPPFRTTSGGLVCRRHPWFPLSPLLPPTAEPARPTPQPACSWLPGGARCAHTARVLLRAQNTALPCTLASQQHYALWSAVEWQGAAQVVGESCIPAHWLPTHKQWVPVPTS